MSRKDEWILRGAVIVETLDGWSAHPEGSSDQDIAEGWAPILESGPSGTDYCGQCGQSKTGNALGCDERCESDAWNQVSKGCGP